jgi:hypothetical protein
VTYWLSGLILFAVFTSRLIVLLHLSFALCKLAVAEKEEKQKQQQAAVQQARERRWQAIAAKGTPLI